MKTNQPYQPLLLRILHGFTGIALIAAMVTAYWTYDTFDGRWLKLPLPEYGEIKSIHGTFGREHLTYAMSINTYRCQQLENLQLDHKEK